MFICDTGILEYVSGKKKVTIPWGKLREDQLSWIKSECTPDGMKWEDPSKLRKDDALRLLNHWKEREARDLTALIWVPSCPLLENVERSEGSGDDADNNSDYAPEHDAQHGDDSRSNNDPASDHDSVNNESENEEEEDAYMASPPHHARQPPQDQSGMSVMIYLC
jgi:hypothetical protein